MIDKIYAKNFSKLEVAIDKMANIAIINHEIREFAAYNIDYSEKEKSLWEMKGHRK